MDKRKLIIGTRGSTLALWQANWVKSEIQKIQPEVEVELRTIKTTGDKILDVPLSKVGGKGLFVKEIEESLLAGESDLAVHSMKDVPVEFPEGLHLAAILRRETAEDALISRSGLKFMDLPAGSKLGTSSLRRACQLLSLRPDIEILQLRGNLDTRIRKLDERQFDAIVVAAAGLNRLGLSGRITESLETSVCLPAIGQGAVGVECRTDDNVVNSIVAKLNHSDTEVCVLAERALLKRLQGGCQVPIAAHATLIGNGILRLVALVGSVSGDRIIKGVKEGKVADAETTGVALAQELLNRGAKEILDEVYEKR
ncbi:MAG: hydroxymethylbilane synthase [Nitrospirae bacterium YQR-1]